MNRLSINHLPGVLVLLVALVAATPAVAQFGPGRFGPDVPPEERVERHVKRLDARLDLSDAQEEQVRVVLLNHHQEGRAWLEAHPNATREERQAFMQEHRTEMQSVLEDVLADEQLEQLEAMWKAAPRQGQRPGKGFRGHREKHGQRGNLMGRLADELELTQEQRDQAREIVAEHREEGRAWREANPEATREERRAFLQKHHQALMTKLEGVLTDEQVDELDALKARWQTRRPGAKPDASVSEQQETGDEQEVAAAAFSLQNYPNPFNPSTEIRFTLEESADVELIVYDVQGREVAQLVDGRLTAGRHGAPFDAGDLPSGVYLYRLTAGDRTASGRMTLVK